MLHADGGGLAGIPVHLYPAGIGQPRFYHVAEAGGAPGMHHGGKRPVAYGVLQDAAGRLPGGLRALPGDLYRAAGVLHLPLPHPVPRLSPPPFRLLRRG